MPSLVLIGFTVSVRDAVKDRGFPSKHQPALNYIALSCMYDKINYAVVKQPIVACLLATADVIV